MTEYKLVIEFPNEERLKSAQLKLDRIKEMKGKITNRVLGHDAIDDDWIVYDDMLDLEYTRLTVLLKVLDERAG